ncbi:hypothetical protein LB504_003242 [Fusarium proliferatum]|nr:hypothetical protein LB504_003242 [Fusarium proliferatum]
MHISCFLGLFFSSSFLTRENTKKLPKLVVTYSTYLFRLGDFLRVKDTVNHDVVSYPWKV